MLSVEEARERVLAVTAPLTAEDVALEDALGRVLARDVVAAGNVPPFANSAMDGFAVTAGEAGRRIAIGGESKAGSPSEVAAGEDCAIRISTGAMLPDGAAGVVMVERTEEHDDGTVTIEVAVRDGENVRAAGEDMTAGERVLVAGTPIGAAEVGVAASAGAATLRCARQPRVAILGTGDELVEPGAPLEPGQIHASNTLTLSALVVKAGGVVTHRAHVPDGREVTESAIRAALETADLLVLSGGVSVGPHDHVKPALAACGVEEVFWRVALRPGKPTWFGTRGPKLVFGLPGNPVSAMVTFLLFARPALRALQGADPGVPKIVAKTGAPLPRTAHRDEMVRVTLKEGVATPTGPQGSHVLTSMLGADGLARVPAGDGDLPEGSDVEVELL